SMSYGLLGTLLLLLPEGRNVQQSPRQLWVLPGETAELSCRVSDHSQYVNWYKEKPDGSLDWIYRNLNYISPGRKYSGRSETRGSFSFTISSVQREDSGVYYCSSSNVYTLFGDGTRLVVTNASEPKLSILVPVDVEEPRQPLTSIPLLCHLHDLPPGWDTVRWQPGGEVTPVTAATVDKDGVLSAWSIAWVSAEWWDGAAACTALENGTGKTINPSLHPPPASQFFQPFPIQEIPMPQFFLVETHLEIPCAPPHLFTGIPLPDPLVSGGAQPCPHCPPSINCPFPPCRSTAFLAAGAGAVLCLPSFPAPADHPALQTASGQR
uniref:Ig-like domain-containing protein n=1 Tax=Accipiter nisus TaxID=211598 RepID=A0A8B9NDN4_9AVES